MTKTTKPGKHYSGEAYFFEVVALDGPAGFATLAFGWLLLNNLWD